MTSNSEFNRYMSRFCTFFVAGCLFFGASIGSARTRVAGPGPEKASSPKSSAETQSVQTDVRRFFSDFSKTDSTSALGRLLYADQLFEDYLPIRDYQKILNEVNHDSPLVEFRLARLLRKQQLQTVPMRKGESNRDPHTVSESGCLTHWRFVGPFDNTSMSGFEAELPPEKGKNPPYRGASGRKISWRAARLSARLCRLDLHKLYRSRTDSVGYLSTEIEIDDAKKGRIIVGASGPYKIWIDGELRVKNEETNGFGFDQRSWPLQLSSGTHRIVVKLASSDSGALSFSARLTGAKLNPWTEFVQDSKPIEAELLSAETDLVDSTRDGVSSRLRQQGDFEVWGTWVWPRTEPESPASLWRDQVELSQSSEFSVHQKLALTDLFEKHARRIDFLESQPDRIAKNRWLRLKLISLYKRSSFEKNMFKVKPLIDELRRQAGGFVPGLIKEVDWFLRKRYVEKAYQILQDNKPEKAYRIPIVLKRLIRASEQTGRSDEARNIARLLAKYRAFSGHYGLRYADRLLGNGEAKSAIDVLEIQAELNPLDRQVGLTLVDAQRAIGQREEAVSILDKWRSRLPHVVRFYREKADLLIELGKKTAAVDALEQGLQYAPQNDRLREHLAFLRGESSSYYKPWIVNNLRQRDKNAPESQYSTESLVEQTILHMGETGLKSRFVQIVRRVNKPSGVTPSSRLSVSYRRGDESVKIHKVRVLKKDGRVSTKYDSWRSGGSRKGSKIYNDVTYMNVNAANVEVGDLVEFRYEVSQIPNENFRGNYFGDVHYLQSNHPIDLERYVVDYPKGKQLYFKEPELEHEKITNLAGDRRPGRQIYGYELQDVPATQSESREPGYTDIYDYLLVSNKKSYDQIAKWWWSLVDEQLVVNERIRRLVVELTNDVDGVRQRVEAIHNYVVKNTRYLHVGLGIHGWKPYRTTSILRNRYGDCKDKSALLKVMLEEAGIDTRLVLVRTRDLGSVAKRPANMHVFNHAIVYVPELDLYLDGTAEFHGVGQLPPMDQDAQALVVDDSGNGREVKLPVDDASANTISHDLQIHLRPGKGKTNVEGELKATGQHAVRYRRQLQASQKRDNIFENELSALFPGVSLKRASFQSLSRLQRPAKMSFWATAPNLIREGGENPYIYPIGFNPDLTDRYASWSQRDHDLVLRFPFEHRSTVRFKLPEKYRFGEVPESQSFSTPFGSFKATYSKNANQLTAEVVFSFEQYRISHSDYQSFRAFTSRMTSALRIPISLKRTQ